MPRRQPRRVEREARLTRELARDDSAFDEHGRVVRAEAYGLAQLREMARRRDAAVDQLLNAARDVVRLLQGELRRARERRHDGGEVRDVAEREDLGASAHLKGRRDDDVPALRLLNVEPFDERVDSHARSPDDARGLYRLALARVLYLDAVAA